jgi:hypothetical protein
LHEIIYNHEENHSLLSKIKLRGFGVKMIHYEADMGELGRL